MADKIGPLNGILETVRLASAQRKAAGETGKAGAADTPRAPVAPTAPRDVEDLKRRLHREAQDIDTADALSLKRGRRAMVREITLWEFGPALREHPEFEHLLDAVEAALGADPRLGASFLRLIDDLKHAG